MSRHFSATFRNNQMKISKTRLKEIIKEELRGLGEGASADRKWASNPNNPEFEGDESSQDAEVRLQQVVASLGAGEDFAHKIRDAIVEAAATQTRARALELMVDALEMLSPIQEGHDYEGEEDDAFLDANERASEDAKADAAAGRSIEDEGSQSQRIEVDRRHQHIYDRAYKAAREKEERFVGVSPNKIAQQRRQLKHGFEKWRK